MTPDPSIDAVSAGQGRVSQRNLRLSAVLVTPVLVVTSGLLVRSGLVGDSWCILALFSPLISVLVWSILGEARAVELRDGHLLTAHTLSGRRTVDLTRLTKVRRIELMGRGQPIDGLALQDAYGVSLVIDKGPDAAVREAIAQRPTGEIAVSRRAAERLQLMPSTYRAWRTYLRALLCTIAWIGAVMVSGIIFLAVSLGVAGRV
ncbi:hypothetical protein [Streptomyces sp. NBC_01446]|uniref:hypothetical protein n=1 Tax=Streptomyces sp. NBC_01446 TaxID=2903870 RepID=UPI00224DF0BB|nr:hypothetical protein [Streptomyces sp. NBC_01446]MCX4647097.1 hypothetical protein [Streptomyces sp. NBC_01446]